MQVSEGLGKTEASKRVEGITVDLTSLSCERVGKPDEVPARLCKKGVPQF